MNKGPTSMVSDQEIAKGVETVLRQSDPNVGTTLNGVVQQLEAKLGLDLSHKASFIRDQINFLLLLRTQQQQQSQQLQQQPQQQQPHPQQQQQPHVKDHFALQHHQQCQNYPVAHQHFSSHFALHQHHPQQHHHHQQKQQQFHFPRDLNFGAAVSQPFAQAEVFTQNATPAAPLKPNKESAPAGTKRRGGPGGLNKVCGVSPELQVVVGEPALPRTEIVKQLWAYIRKNNLQDPSNKRKIICDDALRVVFETDCTDMFKMNKLLAKHIIPLQPSKESTPPPAKRVKAGSESTSERVEPTASSIIISDALAKFFGTEEKEMLQSEALRRVWEYIRVNHLEDPLNSVAILCDEKLKELLGCESISALGISEMLSRHYMFNKS